MLFCFLHELGHIMVGMILKMRLEKIEIRPFGFSASFRANLTDINSKIKKGNQLELKKIIIAFAGPIISVILIILSLYIDIPYIKRQEAIY